MTIPTINIEYERESNGASRILVEGDQGLFTDLFPQSRIALGWAEDVLVAYFGMSLKGARRVLDKAYENGSHKVFLPTLDDLKDCV